MLTLRGISYLHPNKDLLFDSIDLNISKNDKIALIGNNGAGKSTLLKIMAGRLPVHSGTVKAEADVYYVPQLFSGLLTDTVAEVLQIDHKRRALHAILDGNVTEQNLAILADDWSLEERCNEAFAHWQLNGIGLTQQLSTLSGGQRTKLMLAGILIHQPGIVLLDEPSNHLDGEARRILYDYIRHTSATLVVVSHDRTLLNLLTPIFELSKRGIIAYGGNYDFYAEQKAIERQALDADLRDKEKSLRKAKQSERETIERQQKLDARGKKKQEKAGLPTIMMNTLRNNAQKSTGRLKNIHEEKVDAASSALKQLRKELPDTDKMKMELSNTTLHTGKVLVTAKEINIAFDGKLLWPSPMSFQLFSGERVSVSGANGCGKTSLLKMLTNEIQPATGSLEKAAFNTIYIDQDYALLTDSLKVYEQAERFNTGEWQEHEVKTRLSRFLFSKEDWDKPCSALSGGERMRLMLCCLAISPLPPDMIILDEPTNNLDLQNIAILTAAINAYKGTVVVVSHDAHFISEIGVERRVEM